MDAFGRKELRSLIGEQHAPCVSVYLPTHACTDEGQQDLVLLKNLLYEAESQLVDGWMRAVEARILVKPAHNLRNDLAFWRQRSRGLAFFIAPGTFHRYRLPIEFDELVIVDRRFHVKPLLSLFADSDRFFILALSQNKVQLFAASRYTIEKVDVPRLPETMEEALNYVAADRGSQVHSAMHGALGKQAAVFHGQGGKPDTRKDDLVQFFRLIDTALQPVLHDEPTPLLLAGVEYLLPIYREVSRYAHIVKQELEGNCDYLTPHQIHQRAWPLMEPTFQRTRREASAKYFNLVGTGRATADLRTIVPAAHEGRVEALFVDIHTIQWGRFGRPTVTQLHEKPQSGDDDLLDLAVVQTLLHRGTVYAVEPEQVPSGESAAAVFRY